MNIVALDFETANTNPNSACAVGIIEFNRNKIVDTFYSLIRPPNLYVNPIHKSIHSISVEELVNESDFCSLWPQISKYFNSKLIVGHNIGFDINVLFHSIDYYYLNKPSFNYACTCQLSRIVFPKLINHKLSTVTQEIGFNNFKHHNALSDAEACVEIINYFLKDSCNESIEDSLKSIGLNINLFDDFCPSKHEGEYRDDKIITKAYKESIAVVSRCLDSKRIVVSGDFCNLTRAEIVKLIIQNGAKNSSAISKKTDYFVVGNNIGPIKLEKAQKWGIPIISEQEFQDMIEQ